MRFLFLFVCLIPAMMINVRPTNSTSFTAAAKRSESDRDEKSDSIPHKKPKLVQQDLRNFTKSKFQDLKFPKTLEGFGYHFNQDGQLRQIESRKPFTFEVKKGDHKYNQKSYEALGEVITEHVYHLLETTAGLKRIHVPVDAEKGEPQSFFFASKNSFSANDKLLVLIHGMGAVRAGQWARRLIINDCLDSGTQIPYIKRAKKLGYEVMVLNTNLNRGLDRNRKDGPIKGSESSSAHTVYVWDHFIAKSPLKSVTIVAHSAGGRNTVQLASKRFRTFADKVFAVAFTDSGHSMGMSLTPQNTRRWFEHYSRNYVTSRNDLGEYLSAPNGDSPRYSAGTKKHEETSWKSFKEVFKYIEEEYIKRQGELDLDSTPPQSFNLPSPRKEL